MNTVFKVRCDHGSLLNHFLSINPKKTTAMHFSELDFADLLTRPSCGDGEVRMERVSTRIGKKTSGAQSFYVFPSASAFFIAVDGPRKKKEGAGWNTKDLMKHLTISPVTHTHSQALTHTHTRSLTASLFTAPSLGLFSHSPLLWRCNKTDKRQMASEELLLQAAFSRHLVIQPVSWLVNKSTIQPNSPLTKPVSWVGSFFCS